MFEKVKAGMKEAWDTTVAFVEEYAEVIGITAAGIGYCALTVFGIVKANRNGVTAGFIDGIAANMEHPDDTNLMKITKHFKDNNVDRVFCGEIGKNIASEIVKKQKL